jgi:hypothetical protein
VTNDHATAAELNAEARVLHRALFRSDPSAQIIERYVAAHATGLGACSPAEAGWLQRVLHNGANVSALELVLRRGNPRHVLVRKFRIMSYIAEGSAGYTRTFLNDRPRRARAYAELFTVLLRTIWKFFQGQYLLRRFP